MAKVFISYRRGDALMEAKNIFNTLAQLMPGGEKDIFLDLHSMRLGEDWQDQLSTKINACEIMLVVIGPDWLSAKDAATGARRLDNPDDFVRFEIATALARKGIRVVPVLMDGAKVPARADLPENIGKLSLMQGIQIRSDMIEDDVARLARLLQLVATNRARPHRDRPVAGPTTLIFAGLAVAAVAGITLVWAFGLFAPTQASSIAVAADPPPSESIPDLSSQRVVYRMLEPFQDCSACPVMIPLPGGDYDIGAQPGETPAHKDDANGRTVKIRMFAIGKDEVSHELWSLCVAEGNCKAEVIDDELASFVPDRAGHPATGISWNDITKNFLPWLKTKSGVDYRLPSEAEWEYAARAGGRTGKFYWTGDESEACKHGNLYDETGFERITKKRPDQYIDCNDGSAGTSLSGKYGESTWGLRDMFGNVSEFVQDCWQPGYAMMPADGSAYEIAGCKERGVRGGSWLGAKDWIRSTRRDQDTLEYPERGMGFRVARDLPPAE